MAARKELPPFKFAPLCERMKRGGLTCRNAEINKWFSRDAYKQHGRGSVRVTCAVAEDKPDRPLGFFALATVAEETSNLPGVYHPFRSGHYFSALQLVWLATDKEFESRGLGTIMVGSVIRAFATIGNTIGLPHLIVIPAKENKERLQGFYAKLGFEPYKDGEAMFLSLQAAIDTVERVRRAIQEGATESPAS